MTKFHVNGKGEPGPCTAKEGNCPFGSEEEHHDSMGAARIAGEEKLESEHGNLPKHRSEPKSKLSNAELESKFSEDSVHSFPAGEYYLVHGGDNFRETPGVEDGVEFKDWDEEDKFYEDSVKELDAVAQPLARNRDYHGYNWRVHLVPKDKVSSRSPADSAWRGHAQLDANSPNLTSLEPFRDFGKGLSIAKQLSKTRDYEGKPIPKGHAIVQAVYDADGNLVDADRSSSVLIITRELLSSCEI